MATGPREAIETSLIIYVPQYKHVMQPNDREALKTLFQDTVVKLRSEWKKNIILRAGTLLRSEWFIEHWQGLLAEKNDMLSKPPYDYW